MPVIGLAVAGGLGLAKAELLDKPKEKRQRKLAAETQRLSPWTRMQANPIQEADHFGQALQFGATGASMGQGYETSKLNSAMTNRLNTGGSAVGYGQDMTKAAPSNFGQAYDNTGGYDYFGLNNPWK